MSIKNNWRINKLTDNLNRKLNQYNINYSELMLSGISVDKVQILSDIANKLSNGSDNITLEEIDELLVYLSLIYLYELNRN